MGVSFSAWLARDPLEWRGSIKDSRYLNLFWERNFYPSLQIVANDLYSHGLVPSGVFEICIDW